MFKLNAHSSNYEETHRVAYTYNINNDSITFNFKVESNNPIISSTKYVSAFKNWSLWDHDVVEVFITKDDHKYLEVQLSPLNQLFVLNITKPRLEFDYPQCSIIKSQTWQDNKNWRAQITIPFSMIPGSGNELYANIFACLGRPRNYYAQNLNLENRADFHRPDLFSSLGVINER